MRAGRRHRPCAAIVRRRRSRFFLDLLQRAFSVDEAPARLDTAINWGRYGELFDYHADSTELGLTQPE